ncbi:MAG: transposase, partial [Thiobacillus sp.]
LLRDSLLLSALVLRGDYPGATRPRRCGRQSTAARPRQALPAGDFFGAFLHPVACLEAGFEGAMAVMARPERYRKRLRTTNMQERLNEEIRRRERVIRIFPNDESALRLIGALLAEQNETWLERKYLDMQEYHDWAAACAAAREGNNVVALPG